MTTNHGKSCCCVECVYRRNKTPKSRKTSRKDLEAALKIAVETLGLYGNPDSYRAIGFVPDNPAGWFMEDFSHVDRYDRQMPGATARLAIADISKLIQDDN